MALRIIFLIVLVLFTLLTGCSSGKSNPIDPGNPEDEFNAICPLSSDSIPDDHELLGTWSMNLDIENLTATTNRINSAHYKIDNYIDPMITINSWDPGEEVLDVDVVIQNPYMFNAYDVRLIIYTDDANHLLLNADDWTQLFDIPGGFQINPIKAYAKNQARREFGMQQWFSENLLIHCPDNNFNVQFAFEASYPGNCEEPYEITNFQQEYLLSQSGHEAWIYIDIFDWQDDVNEVILYAEQITNDPETRLELSHGNTWNALISNNNGASAGKYPFLISAKSTGSGILTAYDIVEVEISDFGIPDNPVRIGFFSEVLENCADLCISDGVLYAVDAFRGLNIVNISNPEEPQLISVLDIIPTDYYTYSYINIDVEEDLAYIVARKDSVAVLIIVDVSDNQNPFVRGVVNRYDNSIPRGIEIEDNLAVIYGQDFYRLYDVSDPDNPFLASAMEFDIYQLELNDDLAYCAMDKLNLIHVIDNSNPYEPVISQEVPVAVYSPVKLTIYEDTLAVAGEAGYNNPEVEFDILDISDPTNISSLSSGSFMCNVNPFWILRNVTGIACHNEHMYIYFSSHLPTTDFENERCMIYDISDRTSPLYVGEIDGKCGYGLNNTVFSGDYTFTAYDHWNFIIRDVSEPSLPLDIYYSERVRGDKFICNDRYLVDPGEPKYEYGGLVDVHDIQNPENPVWISSIEIRCVDAALRDDILYCVVHSQSNDRVLTTFDMSNPSNPVQMDSVDLGFNVDRIENNEYFQTVLTENHIVVAGSKDRRVYVADITDPFNLESLPAIEILHDDVFGVAVINDHLYVAADSVYIYDFSNPADPEYLSYISPGYDNFWTLFTHNGYLICNLTSNAYEVYSLDNPADPMLVFTSDTQEMRVIDFIGDFAFEYSNIEI